MWLELEIKRLYRFDDVLDPVPFFDHLPLLLEPADTLVLGCWEAGEDIRQFLLAHSLPASEMRYRLNCGFDIYRKTYPHGAAFHLRPTHDTLKQLAQFARSVVGQEDFCDHIVGYSSQWPLFIFHDAFCSGPFYVSTRFDRARVEEFSRAINVPFAEIDFEYAL